MADVKFRTCDLFKETYSKKQAENPKLREQFDKFVSIKSENPMSPFGSSDKPFQGKGIYGSSVPKLLHAHLMNDMLIFYKLSSANPTLVDLYGVFTHDESGTGQPANIKRQKNLAKKLVAQTFA